MVKLLHLISEELHNCFADAVYVAV